MRSQSSSFGFLLQKKGRAGAGRAGEPGKPLIYKGRFLQKCKRKLKQIFLLYGKLKLYGFPERNKTGK